MIQRTHQQRFLVAATVGLALLFCVSSAAVIISLSSKQGDVARDVRMIDRLHSFERTIRDFERCERSSNDTTQHAGHQIASAFIRSWSLFTQDPHARQLLAGRLEVIDSLINQAHALHRQLSLHADAPEAGPGVPSLFEDAAEEILDTLIDAEEAVRRDQALIAASMASAHETQTILLGAAGILSIGLVVLLQRHMRELEARRTAEAALKESEARFRRLADNATGLIFRRRIHPLPSFEYISPAATALTGYTPEEHYADPELLCGMAHPDDRCSLEAILNAADGQGGRAVKSVRIFHKGGRLVWTEFYPTLVRDSSGRAVGIEGFVIDVTARKEAELALERSEQHFRALIDNSLDVIAILTPEGVMEFGNLTAVELLGYQKGDLFGRSVMEIVHPDDRALVQGLFAEAGEHPGKTISGEFKLRHISGSYLTVEIVAKLVSEEEAEKKRIIVNVRDISYRRKMEQALRESEERYRRLVELLPDGIFIHKQGKFVYVNAAGLRLAGATSPDQIIGQPMMKFVHPDDVKPILQRIAQEQQGAGVPPAEERFICVDGRVLTAEVSAVPFTMQGEPAVVVVVRDITERKRVQEQSEASLQEKEVLLKEIHHRVKNNMQIVSSLLSLQSVHSQDDTTRAMFTESQQRIRSMALIHEKLYQSLDFARIDFGEYVRNLSAQLIRTYQPAMGAVTLHVKADNIQLGVDLAIPTGLIVNELLTNALKHGFRGREAGTVDIALEETEPGTYCLTVADDGVGVAEEIDIHRTDSLGLQLVCTLAAQINGELSLIRDGGSRFVITFVQPAEQAIR